MEVSNVRSCLCDDLSIELQNDAKHTVGRRMGWAHVQDELFAEGVGEGLAPRGIYGGGHLFQGGCGACAGFRMEDFVGRGCHDVEKT